MHFDHHLTRPPQSTTSIDQPQSPTSSLTVAGLSASGQSADWSVNYPTSIHHFDHPLQQTTSSLTVAGLPASGQSAGWAVNTLRSPPQSTTSINHLNQPPQSTTSINHLDQPRSRTSSLTVAGFGFRTIGRPV
ncbi:hypothetical protein E8E15_000138 [Penicillium rubens]|nr:hypothetical protein E8E15_000138 [Penicillium rubens]